MHLSLVNVLSAGSYMHHLAYFVSDISQMAPTTFLNQKMHFSFLMVIPCYFLGLRSFDLEENTLSYKFYATQVFGINLRDVWVCWEGDSA